MSGDRAAGKGRANALRDQAIPNVLGHTEVHVAPPRDTDDVDVEPIGGQNEAGGWEEVGPEAAGPRHREPSAELVGVASRLKALAESFATRSEGVETSLLQAFQVKAAPYAGRCGELVIRETSDALVVFGADGTFSGHVRLGEVSIAQRSLDTPRDVVDFFDPSDLFAELAGALVTAFPTIGRGDDANAGPRLRQLAKAFADWSAPDREGPATTEADLIEQFGEAAAPFSGKLGDVTFRDDSDERVSLGRDGRFLGEVIPEDDQNNWRTLRTTDAILEFYRPDELFAALASALSGQYPEAPSEDPAVAANTLHALALVWRTRALDAEATLFDAFSRASAPLGRALGEFVIVEDDDERLAIGEDGEFHAQVLDAPTGNWLRLDSPDDLVASYDPTDVFEDLIDALVDAFPALEEGAEA